MQVIPRLHSVLKSLPPPLCERGLKDFGSRKLGGGKEFQMKDLRVTVLHKGTEKNRCSAILRKNFTCGTQLLVIMLITYAFIL